MAETPREVSNAQVRGALSKGGAVALSPEEQLSGDMLMLTTGFMMCAAMLWLAIYWSMGYQYSTAIPLIFQGLSAVTIWLYWKYRRLHIFAIVQLGLILFTPFAMQWSIGNFVNASGVSLWGLMAPVGAVTVLGTRQSMPWFFAWLFMTVMAGTFDYLLAGTVRSFDLSTVAARWQRRILWSPTLKQDMPESPSRPSGFSPSRSP